MTSESPAFQRLREWASNSGAYIHPAFQFASVPSGTAVLATKAIDSNTSLLALPFSMAITPEQSKTALSQFFRITKEKEEVDEAYEEQMRDWTERMLVCAYIIAHWTAEDLGSLDSHPELRHKAYLDTLPSYEKLATGLTFNDDELEATKGSNLYSAILERKSQLRAEHQTCLSLFKVPLVYAPQHFTLRRYETAAIYLSSRAFPSSLYQPNPTLAPSSNNPAVPILLPIIDSLNHARATAVTWLVSKTPSSSPAAPSGSSHLDLQFTIVCGTSIQAGAEVFNNYGAKPNSELILGYGFAIDDNPDDTIILQLGGSPNKWEIGRKERTDRTALEGLWGEILGKVHGEEQEAADLLMDALEAKRDALPAIFDLSQPWPDSCGIREEVGRMLAYYIQGQESILDWLMEWAEEQYEAAEATS